MTAPVPDDYGDDENSEPGTGEVAAGFSQFRYTQHGATDFFSDGRYMGDSFSDGGDEQPPGYDRHIIK